MAKKQMEETIPSIDIEDFPLKEVAPQEQRRGAKQIINCLRNERVIIRHIPKLGGMVTNPKHILYGGMADNAVKTFTVPRLSSGMYVNVLTDDEKACLEQIMNLEYNALSIYKKTDNFWDDSNDKGISSVRLTK